MPNHVFPAGIGQCQDPVFEGAQGLCLDSENREFFPHVTRSRTGLHNVRILCREAGIDDLEAWYVTRTYLTKHGAGPLPGEDPRLSYEDETNEESVYQGKMRFAPLDPRDLWRRIRRDAGDATARLMVTHRDQLRLAELESDASSWGPCRSDVREEIK